jgi:VanZ family protein
LQISFSGIDRSAGSLHLELMSVQSDIEFGERPGHDDRDVKELSKHDARMFQKLIIIAAWASILAIAFATLTHVGFVYSLYYKLSPFLMRPRMRTYAHFEHVIAFAIFGALFAFAYPRHVIFVCSVVFISAVALEYLQTLTPDRHGTLIDAFEKLVGGSLGIFAAQAILRFTQNRRQFPN